MASPLEVVPFDTIYVRSPAQGLPPELSNVALGALFGVRAATGMYQSLSVAALSRSE